MSIIPEAFDENGLMKMTEECQKKWETYYRLLSKMQLNANLLLKRMIARIADWGDS